jgi:hypothetical protein
MPVRTVNKEERMFEFYAGCQLLAGKSTALRARARWCASKASVKSSWWLDIGNEVDPARFHLPPAAVRVYRSTSEYFADEEFPRVAVWKLGEDVESYTPVIAEAVELGDIALFIDEFYEFAPSGMGWTGSKILRRVVLAGRHQPRRDDGDIRPTHLFIATQYPRTIHHLVWSQAATVMCGVLSGEQSYDWVRANFGKEQLVRVKALKNHEWLCLKGTRPALPGYGADG